MKAKPLVERRADGNWTARRGGPSTAARPCLFLDRDGVLIEERDYLRDPDLVALIPGAAAAIARAQALDWRVVEVTNQAGIGRGYFGWDAFEGVEERVGDLLAQAGVALDMTLACPFHADGIAPYDRDDDWRKPNPGMLREAASVLNLDLDASLLVGDRMSDLRAGERAGLPTCLHVLTGYGARERPGVGAYRSATCEFLQVDSVADVPAALDAFERAIGRRR